MIPLKLFWTFFKVGLFTIGGGYAMIPLINAEVIANGWLTEQQLIDFIAISEATPGAFAINIATFVGAETAGFWGAALSTFGVVLPSLIIIYVIAKFAQRLMEKRVIKDAFYGLRPAVVGLIAYAFISLTAEVIFSGVTLTDLSTFANTDYWAIILFALLFVIANLKIPFKGKKIKLHPIVIILLSAGLGMLVYGVIL